MKTLKKSQLPHISLKNKLLIAFLIIGIIPSVTLGFMLYKESEQAVVSLIYDDIEDEILVFSKNDLQPMMLKEESRVTIAVPLKDSQLESNWKNSLMKVGINNHYIRLIKELSEKNPTMESSKVYVSEIDNIYCGSYLDSDHERLLFHFSSINNDHKSIDDVGTIFIKFSLIIITLSIGASISISYNVTFGITKLLAYTKRVEKGDLDFQIEDITNDEVGLLTQSFNKMTFRLNRLIDKTYRLELSESEARLKALQAQISPHFLYNALDTINWSLIENGDYKTSATLGALSDILRYSIGDFEKIVTVEEEINQITNYLKVQQSRFEERLKFDIAIDSSVLKEPFPKLLLQPVVENAVVHGVERNKEGGFISIKGYREKEKIILLVEDNGNGILEEKLKELNAKFQDKNSINPMDRTHHIGLVNVHERIQLVYGDGCGLTINSTEGEGTQVIMSLGKMN